MKARLGIPGLLGLVALVVALTACGGGKNNAGNNSVAANDQSAAASATDSATPAAASRAVSSAAAAAQAVASSTAAAPAASAAGGSQTVPAGDLDLTVTAVRAVNTKQFDRTNTADIAVDLQILDSRGDSASFSAAFDVKIIDTTGVSHDADPFCSNCPGDLRIANLNKGEHAIGTIYFELDGATTKELDYQRFSDAKVVIPIGAVQSAAAKSAATADPNSSDCQYSSKVDEAFLSFIGSVFGLLDLAPSATPGPGGSASLSTDQAKKAVDSLLAGANAADTALSKISPPSDFKAYHADLIKQFGTITRQLKDAQTAVAAGDTSKVEALLSGGSAFDDPSQALQTKYADLSARLSACPGPFGGSPSKP